MAITRREPEAGLLSNIVEGGGMVHTAGMVADDLDLDAEGQMREALAYLDKCLALVGSQKSKVVYVTIWLADIRDRDAINRAWLEWVDKDNLPARACVQALMADRKYLVELAAVAVK
jgi:enamine deaminase RidA (YjgF/YER057c/UK114 family)